MVPIRLADLVMIFLRAGNLTFGGGDPTVALLHHELVEKRPAITPQQYATCFALARVTPGTNVLAFSAAAAYLMRGWIGAILAVTAGSLPSAFIVLLATKLAVSDHQHLLLQSVIQAIIAAVIGLIAFTVVQMVRPRWNAGERIHVVLIVALSFAAATLGLLPPIAILGLAALYGAFVKV